VLLEDILTAATHCKTQSVLEHISVGSTFHEPSRHWIQRTMFGGCLKKQSGNLIDANDTVTMTVK